MQMVREIAISKPKIVNALPPPGAVIEYRGHTRTADQCHAVGELLGQIEDARAAGARVLLVTLHDCEGGSAEAGDALYAALRAFPGRTVVHVTGYAASSGAHFSLGADFLLMDPEARIHVHSADVLNQSDPETAERKRQALNATLKAVALERTGIAPEDMDNFLGHRYDPIKDTFMVATLTPPGAVGLRWADAIATLEQARSLCAFLAGGGDLATPRSLMLLKRAQGEAVCSINGGKIETGTLLANAIVANGIATSNYAVDGSGNPTAGACLEHTGSALKCAPANLQIGKTVIRDTWFGKATLITFRNAGINSGGGFFFDAVHGVPTTTISSSGGNGTSSSRLYIRLNGFATAGYSAAYLVGCPPTSAGYVLRDSGFRTSGGDLYLDLDLGAWRLVDGVLSYADVAWATASYPATLRFTIVACITDVNGSNF